MTPFTLVLAYYENAGMLREQARKLLELPAELRSYIHLRVVDDGSPDHDAFRALTPAVSWLNLKSALASAQLWRMGVDVRWNQDACRNIGVRQAGSSWLLLTDMDHVVPASTWRRLIEQKLNKHRAYRFARVTAPAMQPYKQHPNSWALTRDIYWLAGGYDEALAGYYGTDGDFLNRVRRVAQIDDLPEHLVRYPREHIPDASTTTLERKSQADKERINKLIKGRATTSGWRPLHFSFPCERLL